MVAPRGDFMTSQTGSRIVQARMWGQLFLYSQAICGLGDLDS